MKAVYAYSGDPTTFGHIDIIKRASKVFDEVIVAIGHNPAKKYTFSLEDRTDMAKEATRDMENVSVTSFEGLLVDFAYMNGISIIIRGIRNGKDSDYESELYHINASQKLNIDTWFLPSRQDLTHISSSTAKALQLEHGLIHEYVPLNVKKKLEQVISGQYIIGITGEIGAGKSYTGDKLVDIAIKHGIEAHNIDMDKLGHELLEGIDPLSQKVITEVLQNFDPIGLLHPDGKRSINRKQLGEIVFNNQEALIKLNKIMHEPILVKLRKAIYGKKGLIFINSALLAETSMGYLCNSTAILVQVDKTVQQQRLAKRGLSEEQIQRRLASQYDFDGKLDYFKNNNGQIWEISEHSCLTSLFMQIIHGFGIKIKD